MCDFSTKILLSQQCPGPLSVKRMLQKTGLNNYRLKADNCTHLHIRHPEQANVEHTVSEESSQVESEEIKTEAYHTAWNKTHTLFISFFIQSKSSSLKDHLVPASLPVLIRLRVERHRPGQKVNPANDLVDDEKDVASDNQESDSCFYAGKTESRLAVIFIC